MSNNARCNNCDWTGPESETKQPRNLESRIEPGREVPVGECPECGALAYEHEPSDTSVTVTADEGDVRVVIDAECNEGWNGDYDPNDPDDQLLLRFNVERLVSEAWEPVEDGSYCTQFPASSPESIVAAFARLILREVADAVRQGASIKRACEWLTWTKPSDVTVTP